MKIIVTVNQIKKILESEPVKLPIILRMDKISKKEFQELSVLLNGRKNSD